MSLYKAELRRFSKRRFIRYSFLGGFAILLLVFAGMFLSSRPAGPAAKAKGEAAATAAYEQALQDAAEQKRVCEAQKLPDCDTMWNPTRGDFPVEEYMPYSFDFRGEFDDMILAFSAILAVVAFIAGASFVGAEWASGNMTNLLLWRPRRLQVLGTKVAAAFTGVGVLSLLGAGLWTGGFWLLAFLRGSTEKMTPGVWQSLGLTWLRGLALVGVAVIVGFALASLGRHTAVALGAAVGFIVVLQYGLFMVLMMVGARFPEMYTVAPYLTAWINKKYVYEDYMAPCVSSAEGCVPPTLTLEWPLPGAMMAGLVVVVLGAAMWSMRRRDVT